MKKIIMTALVLSAGTGALVLLAERGRLVTVPEKETQKKPEETVCPLAQAKRKVCEKKVAAKLLPGALKGEWATEGGVSDVYYLGVEQCMAEFHDQCGAEAKKETEQGQSVKSGKTGWWDSLKRVLRLK